MRNHVHRGPGLKWSISKKYYPKKFYPPFIAGAFIVLSSDIYTRLFNYIHHRRPFHIDDAYLGVAMNDFKVFAKNIPSFVLRHDMPARLTHSASKCEIQATLAFGHRMSGASFTSLHRSLELMCRKNFTVDSCEQKNPTWAL